MKNRILATIKEEEVTELNQLIFDCINNYFREIGINAALSVAYEYNFYEAIEGAIDQELKKIKSLYVVRSVKEH